MPGLPATGSDSARVAALAGPPTRATARTVITATSARRTVWAPSREEARATDAEIVRPATPGVIFPETYRSSPNPETLGTGGRDTDYPPGTPAAWAGRPVPDRPAAAT